MANTSNRYQQRYPIVWARVPDKPRRISAIVIDRSPAETRVYAANGRIYTLPRAQVSRPRRNILAHAVALRLIAEYGHIIELQKDLGPHTRGRIRRRSAT